MHDLASGTLIAIFNNISRRKIGEPTLLYELNVQTANFPDYFPPYYKLNWDGRKLKCISIAIRNLKNIPIGLICFNFDIGLFQDVENKFSTLLQLKKEAKSPAELFVGNWQEQIQMQIDLYLKEQGQTLHQMDKNQKKRLIGHLYKKGVFNYKNAAFFVSKSLGISRASLYNYMKSAE